MNWRVVPIESWPGQHTPAGERKGARRFRAGWAQGKGWSGQSTLELLERELEHLGAHDVILQMAVTRDEIRLDGWIRANASPTQPGVILTFESSKLETTLSYPCDTFSHWQANVRAIALALEALRKVDRYGVSPRGEQYTGWQQLPPAGGSTATMSVRVAACVLVDAENLGGDPDDLLESPDAYTLTYRQAAKRTHPDTGGSVREFQLVQEAKQVLDRHHKNGATV